MVSIPGSYRIRCRTFSSCLLLRLFPSIASVLAIFPLFVSPGGAGCRLAPSSPYSIAYLMWLRLLACRRRCRLRGFISSCGAVLRVLLACGSSRLPSHLIARRLARRLPAPRHGWAGREAGSVGALCLLGFALRSVPMSIGQFMLYLPAMSPQSACLSARLRGGRRSHLIRHLVRAGCVAVSCLPVGSSRSSPCPSSRRSGRFISSLAPSCDTMGGEEGGLLALPRCIRAVSSLSSRIPAASSHGSFD